jgi:hypothetical protein
VGSKPEGRIKDPELLRQLHIAWRECSLCGATGRLSLHHINRHPRDDVRGNLVMLCGSGTTGCHGLIEARDTTKRWELAFYIREHRPDTLLYLEARFDVEGADNWLRRVLGA